MGKSKKKKCSWLLIYRVWGHGWQWVWATCENLVYEFIGFGKFIKFGAFYEDFAYGLYTIGFGAMLQFCLWPYRVYGAMDCSPLWLSWLEACPHTCVPLCRSCLRAMSQGMHNTWRLLKWLEFCSYKAWVHGLLHVLGLLVAVGFVSLEGLGLWMVFGPVNLYSTLSVCFILVYYVCVLVLFWFIFVVYWCCSDCILLIGVLLCVFCVCLVSFCFLLVSFWCLLVSFWFLLVSSGFFWLLLVSSGFFWFLLVFSGFLWFSPVCWKIKAAPSWSSTLRAAMINVPTRVWKSLSRLGLKVNDVPH